MFRLFEIFERIGFHIKTNLQEEVVVHSGGVSPTQPHFLSSAAKAPQALPFLGSEPGVFRKGVAAYDDEALTRQQHFFPLKDGQPFAVPPSDTFRVNF